MSLAALLTANPASIRVRLGTSGAAPSPDDTGVQNPVDAEMTGFDFTEAGTVRIAWRLGQDDGNGQVYREAGLWLDDGATFVARLPFVNETNKTDRHALRGVFPVHLNVGAAMQTYLVAYVAGEQSTSGELQLGHWTRRGASGRISAMWRWSGALAGPVELQFRGHDGVTVAATLQVGDGVYPGDGDMRLFEADVDMSSWGDHGELWLHAAGSSGAVRVANVILEGQG